MAKKRESSPGKKKSTAKPADKETKAASSTSKSKGQSSADGKSSTTGRTKSAASGQRSSKSRAAAETKGSRSRKAGSAAGADAGAAAGTKPGASGDAAETKLRDDLQKAVSKLDAESLQFLIRQAEIIRNVKEYENARRDTVEAFEKLMSKRGVSASKSQTAALADGVSIERKGNDFFNIHVGDASVFFNLDELRSLTRISHSTENAAEASRRLYTWFSKERKDFLTDTGIGSSSSQALRELWDVIVNTYKVKG